MTRHLLLLSAATALLCCSICRAAEHPNVLFIAVDDLRPELGCYGHPLVKSPNIDSLASRGLLFERAYCQQAVCAPSRISLLTGLRPDSTGIYDLQHPMRKNLPDAISLPQHFKDNGYETVSLGKIYHHASDDNFIGWTGKAWRPEGKWQGRGYLAPESIARIQTSADTPGYSGVGPAFEAANVEDSEYPDGTTADRALVELRRLAQQQKPFFLAVGFLKPHLPFNAPQRYWDLYDRDAIAVPQMTTWPAGAASMAGTNWGELRKYAGMPQKGLMPHEDAISLIQGYYACVSYTDALIGQVVDELDRLGLRDNTVIILWGDHGWKLGNYGAWCKHTNFEWDTHVPMILCDPRGQLAGKRTKALVEFVDIFPTLAELCQLEVPETCEGTSMVPLLKDPGRPWKLAALSQYPRGKVMGYSLRTSGPYRYTEWIERKTGEIVARELYDHSESSTAKRNLADLPEYAEAVKELSALLDRGNGWKAVRMLLQKPSR